MNTGKTSNKPAQNELADARAEPEMHIRERAYLLWEAEGRQEGLADEYWHRARELVDDETQSAYPSTRSKGHRI